jgi:hypothetical protein
MTAVPKARTSIFTHMQYSIFKVHIGKGKQKGSALDFTHLITHEV